MAHAGTMDLGQTTKPAGRGNPWMALAVIVAIMSVTVAAVWFTTGSGLTTSSALVARPVPDTGYDQIENLRIAAGRGPLVDDSYDRIEAQRGTVAASGLTLQQIEHLRYGASLAVAGTTSAVTLQRVEALRIAAGNGPSRSDISAQQQRGSAATSMTSGTFHAGTAAPALTLQEVERLSFGTTQQVEQARNGDSLVFAAKGGLIIDGDRAYDPIEQLRGGGAIVSDHAYDPIEQLRLGGAVVTPKRDRVGGP